VSGESDRLLVWNGVVARVPALVIRPASARDVAAAIAFARDHGLSVRIEAEDADTTPEAAAERAVTLDLRRS
jgi:FAD/FMN-containing dehydrogenase